MRSILLLLLILGSSVHSQDMLRSFPGLNEMEVWPEYGVSLYYAPAGATVLNEVTDEEFGTTRLVELALGGSHSGRYLIEFWEGFSIDPEFIVYRVTSGEPLELGRIMAETLVVPGNGYLYASQRRNAPFTTRRKFALTGDALVEVAQPYYHVGLESRTLAPLELLERPGEGAVVATLPADSDVTVLLNSGDYYLLMTPFGLTGWVELTGLLEPGAANPFCAEMPEQCSLIADLYWLGD